MCLSQAESIPCAVKRQHSSPATTRFVQGCCHGSKYVRRVRYRNVGPTNVCGSFAYSASLQSDSNRTAITPEKHCMEMPCCNLRVYNSFIQVGSHIVLCGFFWWQPQCHHSGGNHSVCSNLGVGQSLVQRWDVALSFAIVSNGNITSINP